MKTKNTPDINLSNYEEYLLLSLDGEVDAPTEEALFAFLDRHPELTSEIAAFEAVKMPLPEADPVFPGKEALLKPERPARKTLPFQPFLWSAAAVLLLWAGIQALQTETPAASRLTGRQPVATRPASGPQTKTPVSPPIAAVSTEQPGRRPRPATRRPVPKHAALFPEAPLAVVPLQKEDLQPLPPAAPPLLATHIDLSMEVPEARMVALSAPVSAPSTGIEVRIPAVAALRETLSEGALALRAAHRSLKATEATFSVGNRELFTIRF